MSKTATLIATLALAFAVTSSAAMAASTGPYTLDAKGKCHDSGGKFAKGAMCKSAAHAYKLDKKGKCHDETGKFAKKEMCKG